MQNRDHVVVIGGGLVGLCSALDLIDRGHSVTIVDPRAPGMGASGHNGGILSVGNCLPVATPGVVRSVPAMLRDPLSPLAIRWRYLPRMAPWFLRMLLSSRPARVEQTSIALAGILSHAVRAFDARFPHDDPAFPVVAGPHLLAFATDRAFEKAAFAIDVRRRRGIDIEILGGEDITRLDPRFAGRLTRGVLIPHSRYSDPMALTVKAAELAAAAGVQTIEAEATAFRVSGRRGVAVETSIGAIEGSAFVVSAGAWSRPLVRSLGFDTPLDSERGYGVDIPQTDLALPMPMIIMDHHVAFTPQPWGIRLAGTDEFAGLEAPPNYDRADALVTAVRTVLPELDPAGARRWMNFRPSHPDSLPVIGRSPRQENVVLAYGHGHIGYTLAPITAELVGQVVDEEPTTIDLTPFRATRFRRWGRKQRVTTSA